VPVASRIKTETMTVLVRPNGLQCPGETETSASRSILVLVKVCSTVLGTMENFEEH